MFKGRKMMFTSESITEGHPDKVADQISDAILDEIIKQDPFGRVACETFVTTGLAFVGGEITTKCYANIPKIVRDTIKRIGYTEAAYGFDYQTCSVLTSIQEQSPDIALGVDTGGAGDQGMMFGYATRETAELMPLPIMLAHKLTRRLARVRKEGVLAYLRPDGKSQVTVEYDDGLPKRVEAVVLSAHHSHGIKLKRIREELEREVINPIVPEKYRDRDTKIYINPTGRFEVGGPQGDTGLTGRKIITDTYGGVGSHGGGCFSGKDPTKVDRSASYMARYIAKNLVASGVADQCELQLAYAIGVPEPISIMVNMYDTGRINEERMVELVRELFDLTPAGIIKHLDLRRPIYSKTACYGHFGRKEKEFTWERTDKAEMLREAAGI